MLTFLDIAIKAVLLIVLVTLLAMLGSTVVVAIAWVLFKISDLIDLIKNRKD